MKMPFSGTGSGTENKDLNKTVNIQQLKAQFNSRQLHQIDNQRHPRVSFFMSTTQ